MKVKELIEKLQKQDGEKEAQIFYWCEGYWGDSEIVNVGKSTEELGDENIVYIEGEYSN